MDQTEMIKDIKRLCAEQNAVILAHLYEWPEVQDIADFVGDSLELSRKAKETDADVIVFCGVSFMAETAKILNPSRMVLLPVMEAGCPMADMVTAEDVRKLHAEHPEAAVVCYVNSSAEVKAECDICCTSSNAVRIIGSLSQEEIIFVPDMNLGHYVSTFFPEKKFYFIHGFCPTHNKIKAEEVLRVKQARPGLPILSHPECRPEVLALSDFIGSTAQIIDYAVKSDAKEMIIGTEIGVLHRLKKLCPEKTFYSLHAALVCPNMKKTHLENVRDALLEKKYQIELDEELRRRAGIAIERMMQI